MKLSEVDNNQSLYDFLNAISNVVPEFSNYWMNEIQRLQRKNKEILNLYEIVELFCNNLRLLNANKSATHRAFTA